jgi:uncharacterized protein YjeT (DUF2065 family)
MAGLSRQQLGLLGGCSVGAGVQLPFTDAGASSAKRAIRAISRGRAARFTRYGFYTVGVGVALAW